MKKTEKSSSDVFCTQITIPYDSLLLSVEPVGPVAFPVSAKMAKSLIVEAEPARYGLKDKTLLDRTIRDTWEIPKNRIHIDKNWNAQLDKALHKIQQN